MVIIPFVSTPAAFVITRPSCRGCTDTGRFSDSVLYMPSPRLTVCENPPAGAFVGTWRIGCHIIAFTGWFVPRPYVASA